MATPKMDPRRAHFAHDVARGVDRKASHIAAGFTGDKDNARKLEQDPEVAAEIARLRAETAKNCNITKEMVADGLRRAADMALSNLDATGMVAAWRELGKLLGYYAPEVRKIEKQINKKDLKAALEDLSDEELRQLSQGRVIDGQFKRIDEQREPEGLPQLPPPRT